MRRHGGSEASPSIIHTSSIALLQERFRNLQRVKEMREAGREVSRPVRPAADAHDRAAGAASALGLGLHAAASGNEQPRWFLHPDLVRPSRPLHGPPSSSSHHSIGGGGVQASSSSTLATSPWGDMPRATAAMQNSGYRGDVDVDTSLHL
ncbi:uncharacterized protein LOC121053927 [Oryza brachyantha]|uniref:uncharacterized protein LOC121053927 n=1 Tax=Oryza brachyantha TaxID=4533 RepID=UPI001ADA2069|nr:uncharacterized protein LOC121053927 [Oryza brachyantha]